MLKEGYRDQKHDVRDEEAKYQHALSAYREKLNREQTQPADKKNDMDSAESKSPRK